MGSPTALRREAMTRGKRVYPMMETDCMNDLEHVSRRPEYFELKHLHIPSKQLDLQGYHSLADPDD